MGFHNFSVDIANGKPNDICCTNNCSMNNNNNKNNSNNDNRNNNNNNNCRGSTKCFREVLHFLLAQAVALVVGLVSSLGWHLRSVNSSLEAREKSQVNGFRLRLSLVNSNNRRKLRELRK